MSTPSTKMGLSLYADLLESDKKQDGATTISGAPVRYDTKQQQDGAQQERKKDASLKFQPIKRPQVQQKARPKPAISSSSVAHKSSSSVADVSVGSSDQPVQSSSTPAHQLPPSVQRSNFEDWVGDEEEGYYYQDTRQRGNRKKKKKNKQLEETRTWDWDDIYDPTLPNKYADYKGSEEQYREVRDWKARLYYHQSKEARKSTAGRDEECNSRPVNKAFAPPASFNFAPPNFDNDIQLRPIRDEDDEEDYPMQPASPARGDRPAAAAYSPLPSFAPPSFAPPPVTDDASGEDAYQRRMRMSDAAPQVAPPTPPPPSAVSSPQPMISNPPQATEAPDSDIEAKRAEAQARIAAFKAKLLAKSKSKTTTTSTPENSQPSEPLLPVVPSPLERPPTPPPPPPPHPPAEEPATSISRAPIRYDLPTTSETLPLGRTEGENDEAPRPEDAPRTNRPGQKGFAERLMKKYGWEKGQGLGSSGTGITTALIGQATKRKKRSDADGGGWAQPVAMGKIVGGKRRKVDSTADDDGQFGKMSAVVKLEGMLRELDVQREIEENNLLQEIGEEFGTKYGNVERLFVWRESMGGMDEVFVKFTSELSALRAVNATDGMTFAGNNVVARFFDPDKFGRGEYA